MDQKRLEARLFIERSVGNTGAANRVRRDDRKGKWQGGIKGISWKNKRGKWEEKEPEDRNMTPFPERQFHLVKVQWP